MQHGSYCAIAKLRNCSLVNCLPVYATVTFNIAIVCIVKHGFLLIDKPTGVTSHDIVAQMRRVLSEKKIGHLGTLDPAASGLLVLAVGAKALKVVEFFKDLSKEYIATVRFGAVSTTYDREGVIEEIASKPGWVVPDAVQVTNSIRSHFTGEIEQVPPIYSAVHVGGERAYKRARQGKEVSIPARTVQIDECNILSYDYPTLSLNVVCSSGTYIRSLAHDLGCKLRCGGYLEALRRTKVGEWSVEFAVPPDAAGWSFVAPLKESMEAFPSIELTEQEAEDVRHGRNIKRQVKPDTFGWFDGIPLAVLIPAKDGTCMAHARKVL